MRAATARRCKQEAGSFTPAFGDQSLCQFAVFVVHQRKIQEERTVRYDDNLAVTPRWVPDFGDQRNFRICFQKYLKRGRQSRLAFGVSGLEFVERIVGESIQNNVKPFKTRYWLLNLKGPNKAPIICSLTLGGFGQDLEG